MKIDISPEEEFVIAERLRERNEKEFEFENIRVRDYDGKEELDYSLIIKVRRNKNEQED